MSEILVVLASLAGIISLFELGYLVDWCLFKRKIGLGLPEWFGLGMGAVGILQLVFSVLQIKINSSYLWVLWGVMTLFILNYFIKQKHVGRLSIPNRILIRPIIGSYGWKILGIILGISILSILTFRHPIWGSDALTYWLPRAGAIFQDRIITRNNLSLQLSNDQPVLWSLNLVWLYHYMGRVDEIWVQILPLAIYCSLIYAFWQSLKLKSLNIRIFLIIILAGTPFLLSNVIAKEYSGNADLLVAYFFLLAFRSLYKKNFVPVIIFLSLAAITKNDALPALAITLTLFFIVGLIRPKASQVRWAFGVGLGLISLYWFWKQGFMTDIRYLNRGINTIISSRQFLPNVWYSLQAFREEFRQLSHWGLSWWLIFYFCLISISHIIKTKWLWLTGLVIAGQLGGYLLVYYITPEDQATQIATSIFRLVLQLYPVSFLFAYRAWTEDNSKLNNDTSNSAKQK